MGFIGTGRRPGCWVAEQLGRTDSSLVGREDCPCPAEPRTLLVVPSPEDVHLASTGAGPSPAPAWGAVLQLERRVLKAPFTRRLFCSFFWDLVSAKGSGEGVPQGVPVGAARAGEAAWRPLCHPAPPGVCGGVSWLCP